MARDTRYQDAEWLREKYLGEGLSGAKIGDVCDVSASTVFNWMRTHGIPRRSNVDTTKAAWARGDFDSEETRRKKSESACAVWSSEEYRRKRSEGLKAAHARGNFDSAETRLKMSESHKAAWARGDHDSEETRHKRSEGMKAAWARGGALGSEEARRKMSEASKAAWARGVFDSEETRRKMSEAAKAAHARGDFDSALSEETKHKMSEATKAAWARGAHDNKKPRAPFYPYNGTDYRSTWEVRMVQTFERLGWAWEYEPCRIPYELDDGAHTYTPDFYVPHIDTYFDPHWSLQDDAAKFAAVREQNDINLVVMDRQQLLEFEAKGVGNA